MLFEGRFWPLIADGSVTVTFRRWRQRQVRPGGRYRTGGGIVEVSSVETLDPSEISDEAARRSGYPSAAVLRADLRGSPESPVYRIEFFRVDEPDPRQVLASTAELTPEEIAAIDLRLARLDRSSGEGPWTAATLDIIARRPATRAGDLATELGRERLPFKVDVRKLKNLGLTISLDIGYQLSPRGAAYLRADRAIEMGPSGRDPGRQA